MTISIVLAEDHLLVSQGLEWMLKEMSADIELIDVVASAERAVAVVRARRVDVVMMDLNFGSGTSGIEATRLIKADNPDTKIVVVTMYQDPATVAEAIRAGADAYVPKTSTPDDLLLAIREVMAGRSFLHPNITRGLFRRIAGRDLANLTETEVAILQGLTDGKSTGQVARDMGFSEETLKSHLRHIFRKLGVRDRTGAVAQALRRGLVH